MSKPESRGNNLNFIRWILASSVIFYHAWPLLASDSWDPIKTASNGQIQIGEIAVACFFALSGYLVTQSRFHSANTWQFLAKRALRIYPAFIVVTILSLLVVGYIGAASRGAYWHELLTLHGGLRGHLWRLLTLQVPQTPLVFCSLPAHMVNGALWTIVGEAICYLMVAGFWNDDLWKNWRFVAALGGGFFCVHYFLGWHGQYEEYAPLWGLSFTLGALAYLLRDKIRYTDRGFIAAFAILVLSIPLEQFRLVFPFALFYMMFHFAWYPGARFGNFGKYGDFSYGIYVFGWPVQMLLIYYLRPSLTPWSLFLLALAATHVLAFLSWHMIERPALNLKPGRERLKPENAGGDLRKVIPSEAEATPPVALAGEAE